MDTLTQYDAVKTETCQSMAALLCCANIPCFFSDLEMYYFESCSTLILETNYSQQHSPDWLTVFVNIMWVFVNVMCNVSFCKHNVNFLLIQCEFLSSLTIWKVILIIIIYFCPAGKLASGWPGLECSDVTKMGRIGSPVSSRCCFFRNLAYQTNKTKYFRLRPSYEVRRL